MRRRTCGIIPGRTARRTRTETVTETVTVTASGIRRRRATDTAIPRGEWLLCTDPVQITGCYCAAAVGHSDCSHGKGTCYHQHSNSKRRCATSPELVCGVMCQCMWPALDCFPSGLAESKAEPGPGWACAFLDHMLGAVRCCEPFAAVPCSCKCGRLGALVAAARLPWAAHLGWSAVSRPQVCPKPH